VSRQREHPSNGHDRGSGTLLGLAIIGAIAALVSLTIPVGIGLAIRQSIATAADTAALAAADVSAGISPGSPCDVARTVATANRATLARCSVDGLVVTVRTEGHYLGLSLTATAIAGPPGAVTK
jgi:secretion/DNA translocation related TadE-like protein